MDRKRTQKLALVAAAGVLGVALITLMSGEPEAPETRGPAQRDLAPDQLPPTMTDTDPPAGDLGGVTDPSRLLGASERTLIQRADPETGELKQEFWGSLEPREGGVFDVAQPQARLYLAPWRVIHMRGNRGRFVAPDNHLQSGEFHDDLVITVYESPRDRPVDLAADSLDRAIEVRLDDAAFDTTLGEVRSEGAVDLLTPVTGQFHFQGRGLTLVYNDLRNRIDLLEIEHGESLRYDPDAEQPTRRRQAEAEPDPEGPTASPGSPPDEPEGPARPPQYYRIAFEQDVRLTSGDWRLDAERLTVYATLDREAAEGRAGASGDAAGAAPEMGRRVAQMMPLLIGQVGDPAAGTLVEPDEPAPPGPADAPAPGATLTWSGRMLMTPVEELPEELAASAGENQPDMYVRFEGAPIIVRSRGGDRLACRTIEFMESTQRVTARGSAVHPLRIESDALGSLTAGSLSHRLNSGTAMLHGAGAIEAGEAPDSGDPANAGGALPANFRLTWAGDVELALAAGTRGTAPAGIESATFRRDVRIEDDRFTLRADALTPRFTAADPGAGPGGGGRRRLEAVEANGDVRVKTEEGWVEADHLLVSGEADGAGRFTPTGITARGNARLADPTQRLDAGLINVALADRASPRDAEDGESDRSLAGQLGAEITSFSARDGVRLALANGAEVRGDRLDANPRARTATIFGSPVIVSRSPDPEDDPAVPETELQVLQLRIEDDGEVAWSDGPGRFTYTAAATDADAGEAARRVAVTWAERMRFDNKLDTIQVFGEVVVDAEDSPRELNRITGSELTLELAAGDPQAVTESDDAPAPEAGDLMAMGRSMDRRRLKRVTARGDAVLRATRWREDDRRDVLTRFRLSGPVMRFNNEEGAAEVVGEGTMLIEDYRDPPAADEEVDAAGGGGGANALSGRGATAFTFNRHLRWDDAERTVTLAGSVWMTHAAPGRDAPLELRAEQLTARLADEAEPIDAVGMTGVDVRIRDIEATGGVQVRDDNRWVSADRLEYDAAGRTVLLTALPGRHVSVAAADQPRPLRASVIRWDLQTNELEILDAGL